MSRWKVAKRDGSWLTYQDGHAIDRFPDLKAAYFWAIRCAVADELYEPDGIARLRRLVDDADWWRAYLSACKEGEETYPPDDETFTITADLKAFP